MTDPNPQRSQNRVWILILVLIIVVWIIYALTGGPSTPKAAPGVDSAPSQSR